MGYESRVYLVNRVVFGGESKANEKPFVIGCIEASFELGKMGTFSDIFKKPIDFDLIGDNDCNLTKDWYGEHCKSCSIEAAIDYLENGFVFSDNYRVKAFLSFLRTLIDGKDELIYKNYILVHFGR